MAKKKVIVDALGAETVVEVPTEDAQGRPLFSEFGGDIVYQDTPVVTGATL
jgi:hypothetical protein